MCVFLPVVREAQREIPIACELRDLPALAELLEVLGGPAQNAFCCLLNFSYACREPVRVKRSAFSFKRYLRSRF